MRPKLSPTAWLFLAAAFYLGFTAGTGKLWSEDLWWHLQTGRLIVQQHAIPHVDVFSYTRTGAPWIVQEWGYEVLLYLIYAAGGWLGLIYFQALLTGLTTLLAAYLALRWKAGLLAALLAAILLSLSLLPWANTRPQMVDWVFLLLLLHVLTSWQAGRPRVLWWMPVILLLWVNTHGAFPLGWALVVLFAVCRVLQPQGGDARRSFFHPELAVLRPLLLPFLASVVICLANPNLLSGVCFPFTYFSGEKISGGKFIMEFASPNFHSPALLPLAGLLLVTLAAMILSPDGTTWFELALVLGGSALFLQHGRNGPLLAIVCAPIMARRLSERLRVTRWPWLGDESSERQRLRPSLVVLVAVILLGSLVLAAPRSNAPAEAINLDYPPSRATEVVRLNHFQGPMFNIYEWGGYLIWNLWPEYKVFVDGRGDVYGLELIKDYVEVYHQLPQWRETLRRYNIQWLMLKPGRPPATALEGEGEYVSVYRDKRAELFVRKGGPNQRIIDLAAAGKLKMPGRVAAPSS